MSGTAEVTLSVTAPAGTVQGSYPVTVRVAGDATNPPLQRDVNFVVDRTTPTITITTPTEGARYRQGTKVLADYRCDDAFGQLASCTGTVPSGSPLDTATIGSRSFVVTARDQAANKVSRTMNYTVAAATVASYRLVPTSLSFGEQPLGQVSTTQAVRLYNEGASALPIASIVIRGTDATQFTRRSGCGSSVAAGASCTIKVSFRPASPGAKTATLVVAASGDAGTKSTELSGTGVRAAFSLSAASLSFGTIAVNTTSAAKTVTVRNTGNVVVPSLALALAGTNPGQFVLATSCPTQLPVGSSCAASLKFKPGSTGPKSATLQVSAGGGTAKVSVALTGIGK
jgi:hypothetical protein